jgi:uncharacterized Zn finger protein
MTELPKLTVQDVRNWTSAAYIQRGQSYYDQGRIYNPRRQGNKIKAQCKGSMPEPYRVEITLGSQGIVSGQCSCPIGGGGRCKHGVALLLTWIHEPENFREVETTASILQQRSKEDLIAMIFRMIDHAPQLESLIEVEALAARAEEERLEPGPIQQQAWQALHSGRGDWQDGFYIADQLQDILKTLGARAEELEQWQNAAVVYATVAETIQEEYEQVYDDEGDVLMVIDECASGLYSCLTHVEDADDRQEILTNLWDIYKWNIDIGGYGVGDEVPRFILDEATDEERAMVAQWVQESLDTSRDWGKSYYGGFLLDLKAEELEDDAYLRICRETGRTMDLIDRLLEMGCIEEALDELESAREYDVWRAADIFTAHGKAEHILPLMRERAKGDRTRRIKEWLKDYAKEHNQPEEAFSWIEDLFWQHPNPDRYDELKAAAQAIDHWDEMRPKLLKRLANERPQALVEIHLHENDIDAALAAFEALLEENQSQRRYAAHRVSQLRLRVAAAAANSHPYHAIELYLHEIRCLIDARGRKNYAKAAQLLQRVRKIFKQQDEMGVWHKVIKNLREENSNLPAMQDEFNKANLGGTS